MTAAAGSASVVRTHFLVIMAFVSLAMIFRCLILTPLWLLPLLIFRMCGSFRWILTFDLCYTAFGGVLLLPLP